MQFRAEDAKAVAWVTMEVNGANVATLQSPVTEGQTPLEGILRWTPSQAGTFQLMLIANNSAGQYSDPAAVTIEVVEASAGLPDPTSVPTVQPQPTKPGAPTAASTATTKPGVSTAAPTATTKPGAPTVVPPTVVPTKQPTAVPTKQPTVVPTKQPTTVPQPEIVAFISDKDVVYPGECITFQWTTRNATEIYLETWPVAVPAGERIVR